MNFQLSTWRSTDILPFPPSMNSTASPLVGSYYFVGKVIILIIRDERVLLLPCLNACCVQLLLLKSWKSIFSRIKTVFWYRGKSFRYTQI